jgi:cardiolipin synthase
LGINFPNILSLIRILLTPLFVIFLLKDMLFFALLVFTIAGISDGLDGLLARYFNQRTVLGAYLDPIADKLLLTSAFVSLAVLKIVPGWLSVVVVSRDILIVTGIAVFTITQIPVEIRTSFVSKCTTVAQLVTIFFTLLNPDIHSARYFKWTLYWIVFGLTTASGLHYIFIGFNILQDALEKNQTPK